MIPPIFVPSARDVSARLVAILAAVTSIIFARTHIFAALGPPLHNRIVAASRRLAAILAHLAAGTFRPHPSKPGKKGGPPPIYIPHRRAWLVEKLGYHMAAYTSHLEHLLRAPETQTLLATAPPEALKSLGRTLRPIARLLGVDLPPEFQRAPKPKPTNPPTSQTGRAKPAPLPKLLPLRPRDYPFLRFGQKTKPA